LIAIEDNVDQDFWYNYEPLWSIWDYVWYDADADGFQDALDESTTFQARGK